MNKKYFLHAQIFDKNPEIIITEEEYHKLKQARISLKAAIALEENYDLLLSNYRELEMEVMSLSIAEMTTRNYDYEGFFETRTALNRRLINLLTSARMYLDQYLQHLNKISVEKDIAKTVCSNVYDASFEYRFMEALRNYAQHEGMAVHGVDIKTSWLPPDYSEWLEYKVHPYASRTELTLSNFKKPVLTESPDKVYLMPAARKYIEGISQVHEKVRALIEPSVNELRALIAAAISLHENISQQKYVGLAVIVKQGEITVEQVPIFLEWDDVRQKLQVKNPTLTNLTKRFVSNKG